MENKYIGIIIALAGIVSFIASFSIQTNQQMYFWVGLVMLIGGLLYAKFSKD